MLRLRCFLFGKLIREGRDRVLESGEREFVDRHRLQCADCRIRELNTQCSLDVLKDCDITVEQPVSTLSILDRVEKRLQSN